MPDTVLRYIASGLFDKKAFAPGNSFMIVWGLLFHFIIAMGFTFIFFQIYPFIKPLRANRVITGIIYGLVIWATMFYIVLPLSKTPGVQKFQLKNFVIAASILIIAIGIPLSFLAHKFYSSRAKI